MKISETQVLQANQEADFLKLLADSNDLIKGIYFFYMNLCFNILLI